MPKKPPTKKKSAGRPKVEIDWSRVGQMLEADATAEGVAATIGCSVDTLYNRCKADNKLDFSAFRQQKKAKGDELLKQTQFHVAMGYTDKRGDWHAPNISMLIWLGKQRLGQSDKQHTELTGKDGGPVETAIRVIEPTE